MTVNNANQLTILLIGAVPPPIGGNTVHVQRLAQLLLQDGHSVTVVDYLGKEATSKPSYVISLPSHSWASKIRRMIRVSRETASDTVVHIHVSAMRRFKWLSPLLLILFRRQHKVITIHSGSFTLSNKDRLSKRFLEWSMNNFDKIILVSSEQGEIMPASMTITRKLEYIPAYLPQEVDPSILPNTLKEAVLNKIPIVLTSGYLTPIYNYDILIDCIGKLPNYLFVFAFYNDRDADYEQHILRRLSHHENVLILHDQTPKVFLSIVNACNIYVRPTTTDGDSVAIREALSLGKLVFASTSVIRPAECHLFSLDNSDSLAQLFHNVPHIEGHVANNKVSNYESILAIYREISLTFKQG